MPRHHGNDGPPARTAKPSHPPPDLPPSRGEGQRRTLECDRPAAAVVAAVGIRHGIEAMNRANEICAAQAAEDQKVTQGMLAALEETVRRTP